MPPLPADLEIDESVTSLRLENERLAVQDYLNDLGEYPFLVQQQVRPLLIPPLQPHLTLLSPSSYSWGTPLLILDEEADPKRRTLKTKTLTIASLVRLISLR